MNNCYFWLGSIVTTIIFILGFLIYKYVYLYYRRKLSRESYKEWKEREKYNEI